VAFVARYGSALPLQDDWEGITPAFTGNTPFLDYLRTVEADHWQPLAKLVSCGLVKAAGFDFRVGMYFQVLTLAALAAAMISAAGRLRGWTTYADAFFPLVLLNAPAHRLSFMWCWQITFLLPVLAAGVVLVLIAFNRTPSPRSAIVTGICLLLLPLMENAAQAYIPSLVVWLGYTLLLWWLALDSSGGRFGAFLRRPLKEVCLPSARTASKVWWNSLWVLGLTALALVLFWSVKADLSAYHATLWDILIAGTQLLSLAFGPDLAGWWPWTGVIVLGLSLASVVAVVVVWLRRPRERFRAVGFFLFLGATAALALGFGIARGGSGERPGLMPHYTYLPLPWLCCLYFVWVAVAGRAGQFLQLGLTAFMAVAIGLSIPPALEDAGYRHGAMATMERDIAAGVPADLLAERHCYYHLTGELVIGDRVQDEEFFADQVRGLHRLGARPLRRLAAAPVYQEVVLPPEPSASYAMTQEEGVWRGTTDDAWLDFKLPKPQRVYAIRVHLPLNRELSGEIPIRLSWRAPGRQDYAEAEPPPSQWQLVLMRNEPPAEQTVTFWINAEVADFRIRPAWLSCPFQITNLELLTATR
jgi:hypothetical protein